MNSEQNLAKFDHYLDTIHAGNVRAGWWSDLHTGESILKTRNRPEIMMLVVTEVVEAADGYTENLMDDKLPEYRMVDVELADTAIRLFDLLGAEGVLIAAPSFASRATRKRDALMNCGNIDEMLFGIVRFVGHATEAYRKGKSTEYYMNLVDALCETFAVAGRLNAPIFEIIDAKLAFNATREDHKPENRRKEGGKAI